MVLEETGDILGMSKTENICGLGLLVLSQLPPLFCLTRGKGGGVVPHGLEIWILKVGEP